MRREIGCGGADKWTVVPNGAFPGYGWPYGSGNLFCDAGHYCPNATTEVCMFSTPGRCLKVLSTSNHGLMGRAVAACAVTPAATALWPSRNCVTSECKEDLAGSKIGLIA